MAKLNSCLIFIAVAHCLHHSPNASEPVCSQFDYDKKLMEYIIETRHEVKEMAKDLRRTEEYLLAVLEHRKVEMEKLSEDVKAKLEKGMRNITEEVNSLKGKVEKLDVPTVAFSAFNPADKNLQTNEVLILQSVLVNEGNCYDTNTGKFTAPVRGLYHFTAHVCNTFGYVIHYAIVMDDEWIVGSQQFEQANENTNKYASCNSVSALIMMEPGAKVWIMSTSGYSEVQQIYDDAYRRNSFIGVLLRI
ncbi:heavy metal-binding protein HIP-like [Mercenaria mercenaria]|uniref:heavy metal-binding protein HIP-like n=1 Tax=Mercenaria mercenaria TaxID=6596 RepID=UPI00234E6661|nr:heavy metal-binding protein HIP-like [Mercenaria mercenaria]